VENQQKTVVIALVDVQAVDDLKLLIKRGYGLSYVEAAAAGAVLMSKVTNALVGIIDELGARDTAKEVKSVVLEYAGIVLSKALGFVDRYFEEDTTETCYPSIRETAFYKLAPLRADIKMLSAVLQ